MSNAYGYSLVEKMLFPHSKQPHGAIPSLNGKVIVITGASYGIGREMVKQLAQHKTTLVIVARTASRLAALKEELAASGSNIIPHRADLTIPVEINALCSRLAELPHGIDFLVHNAGKSIRRSVAGSAMKDYTVTAGVNYLGPVQLTLAVLDQLARNKGQILNLSAVNVLLPPAPLWSAYQASKTAIDQWMGCAQREFKEQGITVNTIYLPLVRTRMMEPTKEYNTLPAMHPAHAAAIAVNCMIRKKNFTPWWVSPARLLTRLSPAVWNKISASDFLTRP